MVIFAGAYHVILICAKESNQIKDDSKKHTSKTGNGDEQTVLLFCEITSEMQDTFT